MTVPLPSNQPTGLLSTSRSSRLYLHKLRISRIWYGASVKGYMWKPLWQMRQQKEKEQDAPLAVAAEVAQGGRRVSRAARRLRGGSRGSYRGGASRMGGRGSNRPSGG
jgi:hypothetical protein